MTDECDLNFKSMDNSEHNWSNNQKTKYSSKTYYTCKFYILA